MEPGSGIEPDHLAGMEYDAPDRRLTIRPVLPPDWPRVGITHTLPCGQLTYVLEHRPGGAGYRLALCGRLQTSVRVRFRITCPGLPALREWNARPACPSPEFDSARARLEWTTELTPGNLDCEWSWGGPAH